VASGGNISKAGSPDKWTMRKTTIDTPISTTKAWMNRLMKYLIILPSD
jgi:hypothetical protein